MPDGMRIWNSVSLSLCDKISTEAVRQWAQRGEGMPDGKRIWNSVSLSLCDKINTEAERRRGERGRCLTARGKGTLSL
jgi:hypothetical protein